MESLSYTNENKKNTYGLFVHILYIYIHLTSNLTSIGFDKVVLFSILILKWIFEVDIKIRLYY